MNKDITVVLWLYHTDLCIEFYNLLKPLEYIIDLKLCLCNDNNNSSVINLFNSFRDIKICYYPNFGADIYSFLSELDNIKTPYFIKIHSKKSYWGTLNHCNWRNILIDSYVGDINTLFRNIKILKQNTGYLSCKPLTYKNFEKNNTEYIKELLSLIGIKTINNRHKKFSGGNIFAGNTELFKHVFGKKNKNKILEKLSSEKGKISDYKNPTYCHSMERIFGYICEPYGLKFRYSAPKTFNILNPSIKERKLSFRILKDDHIYCTDQANIYGKITQKNKTSFTVNWLHIANVQHQNYIKIHKNSFINSKYFS